MTTKVTITNSSAEDGHDVEVLSGGFRSALLKPGENYETHVWASGGELAVREFLDPQAQQIHDTPELERDKELPKRKRGPRRPPKLDRA
jgi:hypothetical protein